MIVPVRCRRERGHPVHRAHHTGVSFAIDAALINLVAWWCVGAALILSLLHIPHG